MADNYTDTTDTNFKGIVEGVTYNIEVGKHLSAEGVRNALHTKENVENKTDTMDTTNSSSSAQYPSVKAVYTALETKENAANKTDTMDATNSSSNAQYPSVKVVYTALAGKQDKITAGTASDILTKTETAGTLGTLTKTTVVAAAASASDDKIPTEKAVATAVAATVGGLSFQAALPVGTILMYDGTTWQDNITLPGWYACNRTNYNNGLTPNLEDVFVKGKGSLANTGGSNALTAAMLPKHTHSIYTNATKNTARTASKDLTGKFAGGEAGYSDMAMYGIVSGSSDTGYMGFSNSRDNDNYRYIIDATHEHTGAASSDNSSTADTNTSNMPAYYSVLYIKRCA
jgi:hypothetical protein